MIFLARFGPISAKKLFTKSGKFSDLTFVFVTLSTRKNLLDLFLVSGITDLILFQNLLLSSWLLFNSFCINSALQFRTLDRHSFLSLLAIFQSSFDFVSLALCRALSLSFINSNSSGVTHGSLLC